MYLGRLRIRACAPPDERFLENLEAKCFGEDERAIMERLEESRPLSKALVELSGRSGGRARAVGPCSCPPTCVWQTRTASWATAPGPVKLEEMGDASTS